MKPLTREWVAKAEGDYATARRELRARTQPNYDAACFHAQQCSEKYVKALLLENEFAVARSHNLEALIRPLLPAYPSLNGISGSLRILTTFAVETRYPGKFANRQIAREAVELSTALRALIRKALRSAR